jgi:DNA-binding NtrC family response regulator
MKLGAFGYLGKPCNTEELIAKINQACERKAEQEERIRLTMERYNFGEQSD